MLKIALHVMGDYIDKLCGPYGVTLLKRTRVFDCYMTRLVHKT